MADLFLSFLDFRPLYTRYKLHVQLPSKHSSSTHVYSRSSRINRRPFHLTLFSRSSTPTPSSLDLISSHEHSDGSLIFRFGAPGEAASNVQMEEPKVEKKEIEREGTEDDSVVEVLNGDNDGPVNNSRMVEVTDESNSIVIDSKNISIGDEENDLNENLWKGTDEFELLTRVSDSDLKDSYAQGIDMKSTGDNDEYLNDEQENSSLTSVSPNFGLILTNEHSDGSLIFRVGDLSSASSVQMKEPKVEKREIEREGIEEGGMATDLNGDDDGVSDNRLIEVTDESNSTVIDSKNLNNFEKDNDLGEKLLKGANEFELPPIVSNVEPKYSSSPSIDIENDGNDEEFLDQDNSSPMSVSMLAKSLKIENSAATVESLENNIVHVTTLQSISLSPDTSVTESENDAFQASIDTIVSTELSADSKIDGDNNDILAVAAEMEAALQLSIDAEAQTSLDGTECRNEIVEDGSENPMSTLQSISLSPDVSVTESENDAFQASIDTVVSTKLSTDPKIDGDNNDIFAVAPGMEAALQFSIIADAQSSLDGTECRNEIAENGSESHVCTLQSISLSPDTSVTESENDAFQASIDPVLSTRLSTDSKIDGDNNDILAVAPGVEAALQLSVDAEAQTSLDGIECRNEMAANGSESPVSPQLETGLTIDRESCNDEGVEYRDTDKAKSLQLNIPQKSILVSERSEDDNENGAIMESSGDQVMKLEPTEAATNSQEFQMTDLVLSSGAALLPHPSKVLTGGEDAYFVTGQTWLGVADGVGQWSLEGTNPGVYAQELMKNCEKLVLNCNGASVYHPVELLKLVIGETQFPGSSTVLLAQLVGQVLQVANIGDSGFIILRHGSVYKRSSPMLHVFHFPLQIERGDDPSNLAEFYRIDLEEEDVIILASDGLLDNLYDQEIASEVLKCLAADRKPEEIAEALVTKAQEVGKSAPARSPFADDAQAAGYAGYTEGKLDDVTVIVSVVQRWSRSQT